MSASAATHTLPILSNVLIQAHAGTVDFIATDLEVQITAKATLDGNGAEGSVTVGARKLYDILRALPEDAEVALDAKDRRMVVRAGKSRFNLQTLAAADFPRMVESRDAARTLELPQKALRNALGLVLFAMAFQDIRYYLNGVLFSVEKKMLRVVATDGHRLSFAAEALSAEHENVESILPRKEQSRAESYAQGDRLRAVIKGVSKSAKGPQVILSRTHAGLIEKLFEAEVPEIYDDIVEIRSARIARSVL